MPEKKKKYTEGRAPGLPSPQIKSTLQPAQTTLKQKLTELAPDIAPTQDGETCVFPEAHRQIETMVEKVSINPWMKYMVMGEILGKPKCRK